MATPNATFSASQNYIHENAATNVSSECLGVMAKNKCTAFHEPTCSALDCFQGWAALSNAVLLAINGTVMLELCTDSFFDVSMLPPIRMNASDIIVTCGKNGLSHNNCVVFGGEYQFEIVGPSTGIEFRGVTFVGSSIAAINGAGTRVSTVTFVDCTFKVSCFMSMSVCI